MSARPDTLDELDLTARARNCLRRTNIRLVSDLVQLQERDLLRIPHLGKTTLEDVKRALSEWGLKLGTDEQDVIREASLAFFEFMAAVAALRARGVDEQKLLSTTSRELVAQYGVDVDTLGVVDNGLRKWGLQVGGAANAFPRVRLLRASGATFKEELLDLFDQLASRTGDARPFACLAVRYGLDGGAPKTLAEIGTNGAMFGFGARVARERVRKVQREAERTLAGNRKRVVFDHWEGSVRNAANSAPMPPDEFVSTFGYDAAADAPRLYEGLRSLAATMDLDFPFELVAGPDGRQVRYEGTRADETDTARPRKAHGDARPDTEDGAP